MGNPGSQTDPRIIDLALIENIEPRLSESALIEHALKYANLDEREADNRKSGERIAVDWELKPKTAAQKAFEETMGLFGMNELPDKFYRDELAALRVGLTDIINSREKKCEPANAIAWRRLRKRVLLASDEGGGQHLIVVDYLPRAPGGRVGLPHFSPTPQIAYVLLLFLDAVKPYRRDLCQCRLKSCGKFFFAKLPKKGTGRMQRNYCPDSDHRQLAHRATAPERVRKSRQNRRRKSKHK